MKHDAIVEQGIPISERVPIPEDMIPADSRVEIDAKIQAGYCKLSSGFTPLSAQRLSNHPPILLFLLLDFMTHANARKMQLPPAMSCPWTSLPTLKVVAGKILM